MTEKQQKTQKQEASCPESRGNNPKRSGIPVMLVAIGVLLFAGLALSCGKKAEEGEIKERAASPESVTPAHSETDLKKLVGQWQRPDGGYVIEIRGIRANGELDAGYFNPRPINVSKAKAFHKGDAVKVFIELYDENYPGSTYDLTYDPRSDVLMGTYFQAAIRQNFNVVFVRMK